MTRRPSYAFIHAALRPHQRTRYPAPTDPRVRHYVMMLASLKALGLLGSP